VFRNFGLLHEAAPFLESANCVGFDDPMRRDAFPVHARARGRGDGDYFACRVGAPARLCAPAHGCADNEVRRFTLSCRAIRRHRGLNRASRLCCRGMHVALRRGAFAFASAAPHVRSGSDAAPVLRACVFAPLCFVYVCGSVCLQRKSMFGVAARALRRIDCELVA
jgi:hypothetical protein